MHENRLQSIMHYTMDVNTRYVNGSRNGYIREAVAYIEIMCILYQTKVVLPFLWIRWPVMECRLWPSGLGKLPSHKFC